MQRYFYIGLKIIAIWMIFSCTQKAQKFPVLSTEQITQIQMQMRQLPMQPVLKDEVGVIETKFGKIVIEFFPEVAPQHCASFKKLANHGYFDGVLFHRVVPNFVIQGGDILTRDADPSNDGTGGPGYTLPAEFSDRPHRRGTVSMARQMDDINSAGSQFFICLADLPHLDGKFSVFGQVIKGMDVVDKIARVPCDSKNHPIEPVIMKKVVIIKKSEL